MKLDVTKEPIKAIRLYYFNSRLQAKPMLYAKGAKNPKRWDYSFAAQEKAAYEAKRDDVSALNHNNPKCQAMNFCLFAHNSPWHDQSERWV